MTACSLLGRTSQNELPDGLAIIDLASDVVPNRLNNLTLVDEARRSSLQEHIWGVFSDQPLIAIGIKICSRTSKLHCGCGFAAGSWALNKHCATNEKSVRELLVNDAFAIFHVIRITLGEELWSF
ncbi:MAG: hypothetical protein RL196_166 [Actinomycetota bacterium]